ncbi:unnamed protein product [Ilex paraguariensis]|uniref:Uncharacterized protein n=1 Tax=Ilex paraguariensis TaxID=185542 RepID=A0ABC8TFY5_9AQUA
MEDTLANSRPSFEGNDQLRGCDLVPWVGSHPHDLVEVVAGVETLLLPDLLALVPPVVSLVLQRSLCEFGG